MTDEQCLRGLVCDIGRRLWDKNLVAATDGNISVRLDSGRYLCTPSGVSKGFMQPGDLVVADSQGRKLEGAGKVTSEFFTHLAAYEERPDIAAVVHAHPPKAIAFTMAGLSLTEAVLPEVVYAMGGIPTAPYATPGTREGSGVIRPYIRRCDAVMLDRHGAVTVGQDVVEAYLKIEKIEHACEALFTAHQLGRVRPLDAGEVRKLQAMRADYGAKGLAWPVGADGPGAAEAACREATANAPDEDPARVGHE